MIQFLVLWFVAFTSLMLTLGLLSWIYDRFGGDLGLTSWRRETIIAVIISLLQALLFSIPISLIGHAVGGMLPVASVMIMLPYKVTHFSSDSLEGTYEMDHSSIVAIGAVQFGILFTLPILLAILTRGR